MAALRWCAALLVVLHAAAALASQPVSVPVLAWANTQTLLAKEPATAGRSVPLSDISEPLVKAVASASNAVVLVFAQDQMNTVDLAQSASSQCYENVQSALKNAESSQYAPLVHLANGVHSIKDSFAQIAWDSIIETQQQDVASLQVPATGKHLVIVHIETSVDANRVSSLKHADDVIGSLYLRLAAQEGRAVFAVYTAQSAGVVHPIESNAEVIIERRDLGAGPRRPVNNGGIRSEKKYAFFTFPIIMGVIVTLFVLSLILVGVYVIMQTQNPDRFSSSSDKPLIVPAN